MIVNIGSLWYARFQRAFLAALSTLEACVPQGINLNEE